MKIADHSSSMTWGHAIAISAVLSCLLLYNHIYDKLIASSKTSGVRRKLARKFINEVRGAIAQLATLVRLSSVERRPERESVRRLVLQALRDVAKIHVSDFEGTHIEGNALDFSR